MITPAATMKIAAIVILIGAIMFCFFAFRQKFPSATELKPDSNGIIHHPTYGDYPAHIEFQQGMTIMPGQTATTNGEKEP